MALDRRTTAVVVLMVLTAAAVGVAAWARGQEGRGPAGARAGTEATVTVGAGPRLAAAGEVSAKDGSCQFVDTKRVTVT